MFPGPRPCGTSCRGRGRADRSPWRPILFTSYISALCVFIFVFSFFFFFHSSHTHHTQLLVLNEPLSQDQLKFFFFLVAFGNFFFLFFIRNSDTQDL